MREHRKRRLTALGLAAALTLSLTACGEKKPSLEEVEQAIEAGTLTIQDALDRGWIDQAWVDAYQEENSVPASSKMEANMVGDFTTTTLSGEDFTREQLGDVVFFAFLNPNAEGTQTFYDALVEGCDGVAENSAGIVVCTKSESGNELFAEAPFPVILYNDSLKAAIGGNSSMTEDEVLIQVSDNGAGMTEEELSALRQRLSGAEQAQRKTRGGVGLYNVHRRLQYEYGPGCGLEVTSIKDEGTQVLVRIPRLRAAEEERL